MKLTAEIVSAILLVAAGNKVLIAADAERLRKNAKRLRKAV